MTIGIRLALSATLIVATGSSAGAQSIDLLITGGIVVTMNGNWDVYEDGAVAIGNGRILDVGSAADLGQKGYRPDEQIDAGGKVILPGLINAHTHVPMVLFRGLADDLELEDWLNNYIFPVEARNVTREFTAAGTRLALAEIRNGPRTEDLLWDSVDSACGR